MASSASRRRPPGRPKKRPPKRSIQPSGCDRAAWRGRISPSSPGGRAAPGGALLLRHAAPRLEVADRPVEAAAHLLDGAVVTGTGDEHDLLGREGPQRILDG